MKLDMHFHSVASDGKNTRDELLEEWQKKGLQFLALTDHNRVSYDFREQAKTYGIESCQSVEISAYNQEHQKWVHILLYAQSISQEVSVILNKVIMSIPDLLSRQIQCLNEHWFSIQEDAFFLYCQQKWKTLKHLTRRDIAEYICLDSYNKNVATLLSGVRNIWVDEFYDIFLKIWSEYAIHTHDYNPTLEQCSIFQERTQGILSLAHPNVTFRKWWVSEFERWLPYFVESGINALEINACATVPWVASIIKASLKYNLYLTFWSDNHKIWYTDQKHWDFWALNSLLNDNFITSQFHKYKEKIVS